MTASTTGSSKRMTAGSSATFRPGSPPNWSPRRSRKSAAASSSSTCLTAERTGGASRRGGLPAFSGDRARLPGAGASGGAIVRDRRNQRRAVPPRCAGRACVGDRSPARASIIPCKCAAAVSISKCLYWPALLSAESTPQRWTSLKSPYGTHTVLWYVRFDTQVPFCVFFKTVLFDEVVFLLRGGPMLAPRIPLVEQKSPLGDELFRVGECCPVELDLHKHLQCVTGWTFIAPVAGRGATN